MKVVRISSEVETVKFSGEELNRKGDARSSRL